MIQSDITALPPPNQLEVLPPDDTSQPQCSANASHTHRRRDRMRPPPPTAPSKQPSGAGTSVQKILKFSKKQLALAFAIAAISDSIGALATPLPPIVWVVDVGTALLLFMVLGWQWLLLPGLALEAIPGVGVFPFWLLVVGAIAVLGTPRPKF